MKAVKFTLFLVLVLSMSLAACQPKAAEVVSPGEEQPAATDVPAATQAAPSGEAPVLVMAANLDDVVTLDPGWAGETTNLMIHINTYDTLVDIRPEDLTTKVGRLAESWDISEDFMT